GEVGGEWEGEEGMVMHLKDAICAELAAASDEMRQTFSRADLHAHLAESIEAEVLAALAEGEAHSPQAGARLPPTLRGSLQIDSATLKEEDSALGGEVSHMVERRSPQPLWDELRAVIQEELQAQLTHAIRTDCLAALEHLRGEEGSEEIRAEVCYILEEELRSQPTDEAHSQMAAFQAKCSSQVHGQLQFAEQELNSILSNELLADEAMRAVHNIMGELAVPAG
ncbi:MAG: hypothetical protein SGPRY_013729, partial [Prymnesium sp.]